MKSIHQLAVILPCHTLEDLSVRHDEPHSASILSNWSAIWHPSLISRAAAMPIWVSSDFVTSEFDHTLILAPIGCDENLPLEVQDAVDADNAELISGLVQRQQILEHPNYCKWIAPDLDPELVHDFFALGYAYLQVQLMTRQLRYSSSIDNAQFEETVVAAAQTAVGPNPHDAGRLLQQAFDLIAAERSNYYPTDPALIDLVLLADSTINNNIQRQLEVSHPANWLLTGKLHREIAAQHPNWFHQLQTQIHAGQISLVGGMQVEIPANLMSVETFSNQLLRGLTYFQEQGAEIKTFASRLQNVGPHLPQLLTQFDFVSTIHTSFSGGDIPTHCAPVMNWQGMEGTNLPAIGATPRDAADARSFLSLSVTIGEILDGHHHCPLLFVHWPGRTSVFFDDLLRVLKYAPVFGEFISFTAFNETIYDNGFSEHYEPDQYRFPWLQSWVAQELENPISRFVRYWKTEAQIRAFRNGYSLLCLLDSTTDHSKSLETLATLLNQYEQSVADFDCSPSEDNFQAFRESNDALELVPPGEALSSEHQNVLNPVSSPLILESSSDRGNGVLTLAPFSFVSATQELSLIHDNAPDVAVMDPDTEIPMLRNDYFAIRFSPESGGIRSVNRHSRKGNLFSQQPAIRSSQTVHQHGFPRQKYQYSQAVLNKIEISQHTKASATVCSEIQLVDPETEQRLSEIVQSVTVRRHSQRIDVQISVTSCAELSGPVWNNYLCSRLALPEKDLVWHRSDHNVRVRLNNDKFVAPQYVEMSVPGKSKISLLSGGLPFHRRVDDRFLDTLLVVNGERQRQFEFAIEVDSRTSIAAAIAYQSPLLRLPDRSPLAQRNGWIFSYNCKNIIVTYMQPKFGDDGNSKGIVLRLQEPKTVPESYGCGYRLT